MITQGQCRALLSSFLIFMLAVVLIAGCSDGGTSGSGARGTTPDLRGSIEIVAKPSEIVLVGVGSVAELRGGFDNAPARTAVNYSWVFLSKPDGSQAELMNASTRTPSFTADVVGTYTTELIVGAGGVNSQPVISYIEASTDVDGLVRRTGNHDNYLSNCWSEGCHSDELITSARGKSQDHMATSNTCQACHVIWDFVTIPFVNHTEVFGNCSNCHNGVLAIGKSDLHIETTSECDDCHQTGSFLFIELDGSYDHAGISNGCARCHTVLARGVDEDHIDIISDCVACHNTDAFKPAFFADHNNLTEGCLDCHGALDPETNKGGTAKGISDGHPDTDKTVVNGVTGIECIECHNTTSFNKGDTYNHRAVISSTLACQACHVDGGLGVAIGKSQNHEQTSSDCGNCHKTDAFKPAFVDHTSAEVTGERCDSCHNDGDPFPTAKGKQQMPQGGTHMPTAADCNVCHTPGTFTTGFFDHLPGNTTVSPIANNCTACHDDVIVSGLPGNHVPTAAECDVCHLNTDTFKGANFNHDQLSVDQSNNCAQCHDGVVSTGLSDNHLPSTENCGLCHTDFTSFKNAEFHINVAVTADCASCHDSIIATGKSTARGTKHIPTNDDCSVCHDAGGAFAPSKFYAEVHSGFTRGCEGCHNGDFTTASVLVAAKPGDHLPTNQDCHFCHTPVGFTKAELIFDHTAISGNCASCHDGNYTAIGALGVSATHIQISADCSVCHNITNPGFKPAFVDHTSTDVTSASCKSCHEPPGGATGKPVDTHVTTEQDCGVCHVPGGTFKPAVFDHSNLPRSTRCDSCHGVTAKGKDAMVNPAHPETIEDCKLCHNTTTFAGAKYNHKGIVDNCASCHGVSTVGKSTRHVPTDDDCSVCHVTTGFKPATFDHAGIVDNCESCHDGVFAIGKQDAPYVHVTTASDCGVCHYSTTTFKGAVFDHTGIADNCARSGCHENNSISPPGKDSAHPATTLDCIKCHTTATFKGGGWVHGNDVAGKCLDCHITGGIATSLPPLPGHFKSSEQCDVCHTTSSWAPANKYRHDRAGDYPGNHRSSVGCKNCHADNTSVIDYTILRRNNGYIGFCASCHAKDFKAEGDHIGGKNGTLSQNKNCGASGCHRINNNGGEGF